MPRPAGSRILPEVVGPDALSERPYAELPARICVAPGRTSFGGVPVIRQHCAAASDRPVSFSTWLEQIVSALRSELHLDRLELFPRPSATYRGAARTISE